MRVVIKIGGALLEDPALVEQWAQCVSQLAASGHEVMAVHGGGAALTRTLDRMGKKSTFVNGLRVTDAETRDAALMVLAGLTNKKLVAALARRGTRALGICGADGMSFRARKRQSTNGDLGFVGDVSSVDAAWLESVRSQSVVPVIASIALGEDGEFYNVNADEMASACAVATGAKLLAFLTDVPGVWNAERTVIPRLTSAEVAELTRSGIIQGGMLPKLEASQRALRGGVSSVHILPGAALEKLSRLGHTPIDSGTELVA
ncbi:MAG: acetylglutamate kinase [Candidatus Korobacteraceae bacterium]